MEQIEPIDQIKRYIEFVVLIALVLIYGWATYQRNFVWKDDFSLWGDCAKKSPLKSRGHHNLGLELYKKGDYTQTIAEFKEAIRLDPQNPEPHYNIGVAYQRMGQCNFAIAEYEKFMGFKQKYQKALYCTSLGPFFTEAHNNLGVCYFMNGDIDKAIKEFKEALRLNPNHTNALYNLGVVTRKRGTD